MNTITLIGKISSDLVCLTIGSYRVVQFNIAVPGAGKRNKDTGKNDIGHFPIEAWGRQAEALEKYCTTGTNMSYQGNVKLPVMFAPNTSLAFAQIRKLLKSLKEWNLVIGDTHFHTKKDTPSGTTKELMSFMKNVNGHYSFRNNIVGAKMQFTLDNMDEMIEISYTTFKRLPYAKGALKLAHWLCQQTPKIYTVENFLDACE